MVFEEDIWTKENLKENVEFSVQSEKTVPLWRTSRRKISQLRSDDREQSGSDYKNHRISMSSSGTVCEFDDFHSSQNFEDQYLFKRETDSSQNLYEFNDDRHILQPQPWSLTSEVEILRNIKPDFEIVESPRVLKRSVWSWASEPELLGKKNIPSSCQHKYFEILLLHENEANQSSSSVGFAEEFEETGD